MTSLQSKVANAAGVGAMLPEQFAAAYEALFVGTYRDGDVDGGGDGGRSSHPMSGRGEMLGKADGSGALKVRENSGQVETVGTKVVSGSGRAGGGKHSRKTSNALRNERLFREKDKIDKRLRRMAREIVAILERVEVKDDTRRCGGRCGRLGQFDWIYCPHCGSAMEQVS